ncbi:MAG: TlpA family protein disulfide reductase [Bacteroidia bacterium]|nr:TlpA family protein disulfide reductase [Bacteroidia bacterium]
MKKLLALLFLIPMSINGIRAQDDAVVKLIITNNGIYFNLSDIFMFRMNDEKFVLNMAFHTHGEETILYIPVVQGQTEMVRLLYDNKERKYIDIFLPDGDTTIVKIDYQKNVKHPVILKGNINQDYYEFIHKKEKYESDLDELMSAYWRAEAKKDKKDILKKMEENKKAFEADYFYFTKKNQRNVLSAYIYNTPIKDFNYKVSVKEHKKDLIENYWKNINLTDTRLLHTFLYRDLLEEYISFYFDENLSPYEQDSMLMVGVKKAMDAFSETEAHRNFAYNFLINGFESQQNTELISYITIHYAAPEQCDTEGTESSVDKVAQANERMRPGKPAPELPLLNTDGSPLTLREIKSDTVLVLFFSSQCSHCVKALPELDKMIRNTHIQVVAVSTDKDETEYSRYIKKYPDWIHYCDFRAGDSRPVREYNISSTPTFILLDKDRRIIDKYRTVDQLRQVILKK